MVEVKLKCKLEMKFPVTFGWYRCLLTLITVGLMDSNSSSLPGF